MKKKIIIGVPESFSLHEEIVKNLEFCGYEVIDVSFNPRYKYKKLSDKIRNFINKSLFRDTSLKKKLRLEKHVPDFEKKILEHSEVDYALFIRPDLYPIEFLEFVKTHSKKMIAYQWDGMKVFPEIKKYTHLFNRFFVFDKDDVKDPFIPLTNFYFDYRIPHQLEENKKKSVYFVGSYFKNRIGLMKKMAKTIIKAGFDSNINVFSKKKAVRKKHKTKGIHFMDSYIDFNQNLNNVCSCSVLVDFLNNVHNGLSLRTFEALGYQKKLITNNLDIIKYDFYNENNIFIFNENNIPEIEEFLKKPYIKIDDSIREKYSFSNWIKYVLDETPHQKITLP